MTVLENTHELGNDLTFDGHALFLPQRLPENVRTFKSSHPVDNSAVTIEVNYICFLIVSSVYKNYSLIFC